MDAEVVVVGAGIVGASTRVKVTLSATVAAQMSGARTCSGARCGRAGDRGMPPASRTLGRRGGCG
jgi:hypothetical protein